MASTYYVSKGGFVSDLFPQHIFVTLNGRRQSASNFLATGLIVNVFVRHLGGKGGYGQLLKDFGKETALSRNKKSCRDLSGRIVRDLDDIEDLKNWVRDNPGRIQQKKEERVKRLERSLIEPKHMMDSSKHREHISNITEAQNSAFDAFRKRKNDEDEREAEATERKKTKKWYEKDEPEPEKPKPMAVKSPAMLRNEVAEDHAKSVLAKKFGKGPINLTELSKESVQIKNGSVVNAPKHAQIQKERKIWDTDFCETTDPDELKQIAIAKREREYQAQQAKTKATTEAIPEKPTQEFSDINLGEIESMEQLHALGLDHLKHLLQIRKLKCGGNLVERSKRLFTVRNLKPADYPKKLRAK